MLVELTWRHAECERRAQRERGSIGEVAWERGAAAEAVAGLAPGVKKLRGGARERSLSFIFVLIAEYWNSTASTFKSITLSLKTAVCGTVVCISG